ncbi:hypothetical protein AWJ20_3596 [Sugiyamaella lignohabitans]|uniref:DUF1746 domain-containing protein n=1 Tax=Sugiyamaella lignohabitans TaxID=796027 RepID=A0A170QXM8_9ASCO|nr:uncharacterized protein AWJ20_3596 [Sugiyamaella lignohabitans]ANB15949.1 hypothetical protein AWJ20_3596 [Sugiyamaella lignohabitans]
MHALSDLPKPSSGLYLQGGLTIEFIGVRALESKFPLFVWDFILLSLQLIAFAINFPVKDHANNPGTPSSSHQNESGTRSGSSRDDAPLTGAELGTSFFENEDEPGQAVHPYSGQFLVCDISIFQSLSQNWAEGRRIAAQASVSATTGDAELSRTNDV